jgi:uroporphyrinogen decarboxylase
VVPALERIADALGDFVARNVEAGAVGVFYAIAGFASEDLLSAAEYDELVMPLDRRVLGSIPDGAWLNVLHLCGARQRLDVASLLGLRTVSWSIHEPGNPPLAEGLADTGRAVMGGIDLDTLSHGTPDEVLEQGRAAADATAGVGLVLAPGCSVPPGAPAENVRAIGESVGARAA